MTRIAIIGAGLSGLTLAQALQPGCDVVVFEKGRGVGGRMATRYADDWQFDHGAQFFTAETDAFQNVLAPLISAGAVARWDARFAEFVGSEQTTGWQWGEERPHYVGAPKMTALAKTLARDLDIHLATRVGRVERGRKTWALSDDAGEPLGDFDWCISTAPAPQGIDILPAGFSGRYAMDAAPMRACFALMLGFDAPLPFSWDAAHVGEADISWMSVDSAKPGRESAPSLLVHSTNAWADAHLEKDRDWVTEQMIAEASRISGHDLSDAAHIALHRWRFANLPRRTGPTALIDTEQRLGACGDWCFQGRIEAAFLSARSLADQIIATF